MNTYIIICALGTRKGTIVASSRAKAMDKYIGSSDYPKDSYLRSLLIAIEKEELKVFQKQVVAIK